MILGVMGGGLGPTRVSAGESALDYWPSATGTTWVYVNEQGQQQVVRVAEPQVLDGEMVTVVERTGFGDAAVTRSFYAVREGQVMQVAVENPEAEVRKDVRRLDPPILVWPAYVAPGVTWQSDHETRRATASAIQREETMVVPTGTYRTLVVLTTTVQGRTVTKWFAPGVGVVRTVATRADDQRVSTIELRRFIPPAGAETPAPAARGAD